MGTRKLQINEKYKYKTGDKNAIVDPIFAGMITHIGDGILEETLGKESITIYVDENNFIHNENGPAIIHDPSYVLSTDAKYYYNHGCEISYNDFQHEFKKLVASRRIKKM